MRLWRVTSLNRTLDMEANAAPAQWNATEELSVSDAQAVQANVSEEREEEEEEEVQVRERSARATRAARPRRAKRVRAEVETSCCELGQSVTNVDDAESHQTECAKTRRLNSNARSSAAKAVEACTAATKAIAQEYICPITLQLPLDPVMAMDGRTYEREAIEQWLWGSSTHMGSIKSPATGEEMMDTTLVPAVQVRNTIEHMVNNNLVDEELSKPWRIGDKMRKLVKQLEQDADKGDAEAMHDLASYYAAGEMGLGKNLTKARRLHARACEHGYTTSMTMYSTYLLRGFGGHKNTSLGLVLLSRAESLGSQAAGYILGNALAKGHYELSVSPRESIKMLQKVYNGEYSHCDLKPIYMEKVKATMKLLEDKISTEVNEESDSE